MWDSSAPRTEWLHGAALALGLALGAALLWPRVGVRDVDAYSYLVGAYSLQAGRGYVSLSGAALNHWPPGYSWLLSWFATPLRGAWLINNLAWGAVAALIYAHARRSAWERSAAWGVALALACNFCAAFATNVSPDTLTYAVFLFAFWLWRTDQLRKMLCALCLLNLLIILKYVAVVFVPAILLARLFDKGAFYWLRERALTATGVLGWLGGIAGVMWLNRVMAGAGIPVSHITGTGQQHFVYELRNIAQQIPRGFLSEWYGSLYAAGPIIGFSLVLVSGMVCLLTLRPQAPTKELRGQAIGLFALTLLMRVFKVFTGIRLFAYGLVLGVLSCRVAAGKARWWLLYGVLSVLLLTANGLTANRYGVNDARYEKLAREAVAQGWPEGKVYTNSFHLLDVHERQATLNTLDAQTAQTGDYFLQVTLPQYDAVAKSVRPVVWTGTGWRQVWSIEGATLWERQKAKEGKR